MLWKWLTRIPTCPAQYRRSHTAGAVRGRAASSQPGTSIRQAPGVAGVLPPLLPVSSAPASRLPRPAGGGLDFSTAKGLPLHRHPGMG